MLKMSGWLLHPNRVLHLPHAIVVRCTRSGTHTLIGSFLAGPARGRNFQYLFSLKRGIFRPVLSHLLLLAYSRTHRQAAVAYVYHQKLSCSSRAPGYFAYVVTRLHTTHAIVVRLQ